MKEIPKELYDALDVVERFCDNYDDCDEICPLYNARYCECDLSYRSPNIYHDILCEKDGKCYTCIEEENKRSLGI